MIARLLALAIIAFPVAARSATLGVNLAYAQPWAPGGHIWSNAAKPGLWWGVTSWGTNGYPSNGGAAIGPFQGTMPSYYSGNYSLRFHGQAGTTLTGHNGVTIGSGSYDAGTGIWTYTNTININASSNPTIEFSTAVDSIWLGYPGTSYPTTAAELFNSDFTAALAPFTVVRAMQPGGNNTSGNTGIMYARDTTWSNRTAPGSVGFGMNGAAFEEWIVLANALGKDIWICVNRHVDDAYFTNLANLLRYGSDASGTPYTTDTNDPATWTPSSTWWPGLATGRNVYVEFDNEIWNYSAADATSIYNAEVSGGDPHHFTATADGGYDKWIAWKVLKMSTAFRAVWGDSAMGTRVRMVLANQGDWGTWWRHQNMLTYITTVFTNGGGTYGPYIDGVPTGHPVSYYIHDISGSFYLHWAAPADTNTAFSHLNQSLSTNGGLPAAGENNSVLQRYAWCDSMAGTYGIKCTAYEAGTEIQPAPSGSNISALSDADSRMQTLMVDKLHAFANLTNDDVYMYFFLTGPGGVLDVGLGPDLATRTSYRWAAMNSIAAEWGGPTLVSIAVAPASASKEIGQTQQWTCTAVWSSGPDTDCTTSADWTSSQTGVATIGLHTGLATAVGAGSTTIEAAYSGQTDTSPMTVSAAPPVGTPVLSPVSLRLHN